MGCINNYELGKQIMQGVQQNVGVQRWAQKCIACPLYHKKLLSNDLVSSTHHQLSSS